jgi:putative permease
MLLKVQALWVKLAETFPSLFAGTELMDLFNLGGQQISEIGRKILSVSFANLANVVAILIYVILVPILVFFFLKDRDILVEWLASFLPPERPIMNKIWLEMNEQIANYVRGKFIQIIIVGGVTYIAFKIIGLEYAALLGFLVGISVVVPYIGAAVVTIPVAISALFQWGWGTEFFYLMAVYGVIQALDGNILVPLLFSEVVNLHPVAIILSVLVFGGFWGLWGVFFAIPLATLIKAILNAWPKGRESVVV